MTQWQQAIVDRFRYALKHNQSCTIGADEVHIPMNAIEEVERLQNQLTEVAELAQAKADGRVVAYGEWLNFVGDYSTAECSQCENIYEVSPDEKPCEDYFNAFKQFYKYCPNCGAKMDKERDNNA